MQKVVCLFVCFFFNFGYTAHTSYETLSSGIPQLASVDFLGKHSSPLAGCVFRGKIQIVGEPRPRNERFVHPSPQKRFDSGLLLFDNS